MGISIKTAGPIRAHEGKGLNVIRAPAMAQRPTTSAYRWFNNANSHSRDSRSFVSCISASF